MLEFLLLQQYFPVPSALTEATSTRYSVPGSRPVTLAGDDWTMHEGLKIVHFTSNFVLNAVSCDEQFTTGHSGCTPGTLV